jgi:hypothetical protein
MLDLRRTVPSNTFTDALLIACCLTHSAAADTVVFQNGDRLTGAVLEINSISIAFSNSAIGKLQIPWSAVAEIRSANRWAAEVPKSSPNPGNFQQFHTAVVTLVNGALSVKLNEEPPQPFAVTSKLVFAHQSATPPGPGPPAVPTAAPKRPASAHGPPTSHWLFNINAPFLVTAGTENQLTWGGLFTFDLTEGNLNHTKLNAAGTHNRNWEVGSPFVTTDTFDAYLQQGRSFGGIRGGAFAKAEMFFNTSLGVALEKSYGAGLYSRTITKGPVSLNGSFDTRYFNERLYGGEKSLDLVGSRFEGQSVYRRMDPEKAGQVKFLVIAKAWINPMWNNERALQGYGFLQLSVPFGQSVCLSLSPVENDYVRNAPAGKRKNYFSSSVSLKIEHGANPKERCYGQ